MGHIAARAITCALNDWIRPDPSELPREMTWNLCARKDPNSTNRASMASSISFLQLWGETWCAGRGHRTQLPAEKQQWQVSNLSTHALAVVATRWSAERAVEKTTRAPIQ